MTKRPPKKPTHSKIDSVEFVRVAKRGPKSWTAKQLEAVRVYYVSVRGHVSKTAKKFTTSAKTVRTLAAAGKWDDDIPRVDAQTREISNRTVAESRAVAIATIDTFIDDQVEHAKSKRMRQGDKEIYGFDPPNFERMVKTRELLTGGATDRLDAGDLFTKFDALDDDGKRDFITKLRERAARLRSESA